MRDTTYSVNGHSRFAATLSGDVYLPPIGRSFRDEATAHIVRFDDDVYVAVCRTQSGTYLESRPFPAQYLAEHELRYWTLALSLQVDFAGVVDRVRDHHGNIKHGGPR